MRMMALMRHGLVAVKELDLRNSISIFDKNGKRRRRKGQPRKRQRDADVDDSSGDSTNTNEERGIFKQCLSSVFGDNASSLNLQRTAAFQWPSHFCFQNYAAQYGWNERKLHQTPLHRFEGANPDIIFIMFEHMEKTKVIFNLTTMEVHNGDECRTCMEFQKTGEVLRAIVLNGTNAKRPAHGHAIPKGMKSIVWSSCCWAADRMPEVASNEHEYIHSMHESPREEKAFSPSPCQSKL